MTFIVLVGIASGSNYPRLDRECGADYSENGFNKDRLSRTELSFAYIELNRSYWIRLNRCVSCECARVRACVRVCTCVLAAVAKINANTSTQRNFAMFKQYPG